MCTTALLLLLQASPQDLQVSGHAGFGGIVARGEWTPLTVDLDYRGKEDLDLVLSFTWGQGQSVQDSANPALSSLYGKTGPVHRLPVSIAARSRKRLSISLRAPLGDTLQAWAFAENARTGRSLAAAELRARSLPAGKRFAAVVGSEAPEGLGGWFSALAAPEHLPEDWRAYGGVDVLFWLDAKPSELRSQAQADALRTWVEFGGRLVVARSSDLGLAGSPIGDLLPAIPKGARRLPGLPALAGAAGSAPAGPAMILDSAPRGGRVRLEQDGVPLVIDAPLGTGRSIFVALDPLSGPFSGWTAAERFWPWLLPPGRPAAESGTADGLSPPPAIGAVSLAQSAGQFPDVAPPAIGGLFLLIVIYLVIVGPFDYFVLKKLRRLELTWITFPAYVTIFTLLILFSGGAFIERAAYQREILVIDRAAGAAQERRLALSAVLAPRNQRYSLTDVEPVSSNYLTSQFASLDLGNAVLARLPEAILKDWTVARGATGLVAVDRARPARGSLRWTLHEGSLSIRNETGGPLRPAVLLAGGAAWEVDPIPAGVTEVRISKKHATIDAYLNAEGAAGEQGSVVDPSAYTWSRDGFESAPRTGGIKEQTLDASVRRMLLNLSFGSTSRGASGFARSLDATDFLRAGGSMLLVWEKHEQAEAAFDPLPNRFTGLALIRYFQGPSK